MKAVVCILTQVGLCWLTTVSGHGRLIDPPSRTSMWRYGFKTPPNYNDNQLYCGGMQVQYEQNGGRCGICGDPWQGPRESEPPGKYANGIIVRKYDPGQVITVVIELTANHKGWMEFRLCPNDDSTKTVTQSCLDKHVLTLADTNTKRYMVSNKNGYDLIRLKLRLPSNIRCKDCVFQWKYNAGNSWGRDARTGNECIGCGNQEQFYGCADIAIGHDDIVTGAHKKLPADMDETDSDNNNNGEHLPPPIPGWDWSKKPAVSEGDIFKDGDADAFKNAFENIVKANEPNKESFRFLPIIRGDGVSPCMCICKASPVVLHGGTSGNLNVKLFEGHDDKQVCMCMCQNSSSMLRVSPMVYIAPLLVVVWLLCKRR